MSKYDENERKWRREYNKRPEVKARQKEHIKKYASKPEVKEKIRVYIKDYMRDYWKKNPEKYIEQKMRVAESNKLRRQRQREFANKNPKSNVKA